MRHFVTVQETTQQVITDIADATNAIIRVVIAFAPVGIFGLVVATFAQAGFRNLKKLRALNCCTCWYHAFCSPRHQSIDCWFCDA